jgi:uncharacterized protein YndB with AHSA1/START domain
MTATAQVSRVIPAKAEDVWETLTSKEGVKAYMMGAERGHRLEGRRPLHDAWRVTRARLFEDGGEVRSFEPGRKLAYTHVSSADPSKTEHLVTFDLTPKDGGTEVTVTPGQDRRRAPRTTSSWQRYEKTWAGMLESLEKAVAN